MIILAIATKDRAEDTAEERGEKREKIAAAVKTILECLGEDARGFRAPVVIAYVVGIALIVAGVGLFIRPAVRTAAAACGMLLLLLTVFFYVPIFATEIHSDLALEGINYVGDTLLFAGTVFLAGFGAVQELFFLMHKLGILCIYVPVTWKNKPGSRINFPLCFVRDPTDMLRIRLRDIAHFYENPVSPQRQPWNTRT